MKTLGQLDVSVVVPAYNGEAYIAETLSNILAQTHRPREVIVINDGSTDRTAEVVGKFGGALKLISTPNNGVQAARDLGSESAQGTWIALCDQDDLWDADYLEMQSRLVALNVVWRGRGIEQPFRARIGINTGFVNVGNFGSIDRLDYTIIGGEANLAARLEQSAEPGGIVLSYETYALVRDIVSAREQPAIRVKGINRDVIPFVIDGLLDGAGTTIRIVNVHAPGLDLYLDPSQITSEEAERVRKILRDALGNV